MLAVAETGVEKAVNEIGLSQALKMISNPIFYLYKYSRGKIYPQFQVEKCFNYLILSSLIAFVDLMAYFK